MGCTDRIRDRRGLCQARRLLLMPLFVLFGAAPAPGSTVSFAPGVPYEVGRSPRAVAVADLDGDGCPDLAAANSESRSVSVMLGNGDGTFAPRTDFTTGPKASAIGIADLDGDGRPDLVTAGRGDFDNHWFSSVSVLLGNGDGTFAARTDFACGDEPMSMAIGDLDLDGRPDVAVVNREGPRLSDVRGKVTVLLGNGDGTLTPLESFGSWPSPRGVAIADLDGDGTPDLAVTDYHAYYDGERDYYDGRVSVLRGNGDGAFGPRADYASGGVITSLAIADLDDDGRRDIAVTSLSSNTVAVHRGHGDGTFGAETPFGSGLQPYAMATGDLDGDGALDLVTTNLGSASVSVLPGRGDGTFGAGVEFAVGDYPYSVAVGDLDRDGRPDLAVANRNHGTVSVLLNRTAPPPPIETRFDLSPATLNPAARGRWVTGALQPPAPYAAADIDIASIRLNGTVAADPTAPTAIGDHDRDGLADLTVRFDRAALVATLAPGDEVPIRVTGTVGGQAFAGVATLRVLNKTVSKPAPAGPAIHRASLRPAVSGRLRVEFSLDEAGPARLEVMDVAGRVVASRQVGAFGPGAHALDLEEADALRSGVYFLRLSQGGNSVRARVAVIR